MSQASHLMIDLEPVGRRIDCESDTTLLEAVQLHGIQLVSLCGGIGACRGCLVQLMEGKLTPVTLEEESQLTESERAEGCRLACQAMPLTDVRIDIPSESLSTPQRLQVESEALHVSLDPLVKPLEITLSSPTTTDLRSDMQRLTDAVGHRLTAEPPMMSAFGRVARVHDWRLRLAVRDTTLVGVLPSGNALLGLAVDIGTTKLAAYLLELETGTVLAKAGAMNPQIAYGEDVISRIVYAASHANGAQVLQERLIDSLNELIATLCKDSATQSEQIAEIVLVGNTIMHHLLAGLPVEPLGEAPYVASTLAALELSAASLRLNTAAGARVYLPPLIAGYVGADHTAMLLSTGIGDTDETCLAIDIGTNTEITLAHREKLWSCSCASGPAFEGAHIRQGMRAAVGAIERVQIVDGQVRVTTIGGQPAVGICGSGILDAVAMMVQHGIVDPRGALDRQNPGVCEGAFILAQGEAGAIGVTRQDVSEVQLAKAAIRVGIDLLLREAGIAAHDLSRFIIAGAFGSYITVESAVRIGMFPSLPRERFRQVGNAAGLGACQMLLSAAQRREAEHITRRIHYVELTTHDAFQANFITHLSLRDQEN